MRKKNAYNDKQAQKKRAKRIAAVVLAIACGLGFWLWTKEKTPVFPDIAGLDAVTVERVVDGDTLLVLDAAGESVYVRLIGADAPESAHPDASQNTQEGRSASAFMKEHADGRTVYLEYDVEKTDRYGRILAYVYTADGTMLNLFLLEEGYAQVMTVPPNVHYAGIFAEAERNARAANKGLWATGKAGATP